MDSNLHTCRKRGCDAGKMGEVGPPRRTWLASSHSLIRTCGAQWAILLCEAIGLGVINSWEAHKARDTP